MVVSHYEAHATLHEAKTGPYFLLCIALLIRLSEIPTFDMIDEQMHFTLESFFTTLFFMVRRSGAIRNRFLFLF